MRPGTALIFRDIGAGSGGRFGFRRQGRQLCRPRRGVRGFRRLMGRALGRAAPLAAALGTRPMGQELATAGSGFGTRAGRDLPGARVAARFYDRLGWGRFRRRRGFATGGGGASATGERGFDDGGGGGASATGGGEGSRRAAAGALPRPEGRGFGDGRRRGRFRDRAERVRRRAEDRVSTSGGDGRARRHRRRGVETGGGSRLDWRRTRHSMMWRHVRRRCRS